MNSVFDKLINLSRGIKISINFSIEFIISIFSLWAAQSLITPIYNFNKFLLLDIKIYFLFSTTFILIQLIFKTYLELSRYFRVDVIYKIIKNFIVFILILTLYKFFLFRSDISKFTIFLYLAIFFILIVLKNSLLHNIYNFLFHKTSIIQKKLLFYDFNEKSRNYFNILKNHHFSIVGVIKDNIEIKNNLFKKNQIFDKKNIENIIKKYKITDILISKEITYKDRIFFYKKFLKFNLRVVFIDEIFSQLNLTSKIKIIQPNLDDVINDGRHQLHLSISEQKKFLNKKIIILGGAGSIGSNLSKKIISFKPKQLVIIDKDEFSLYEIQNDLGKNKNIKFILLDAANYLILEKIFNETKPDFVFNAAAYKHVKIVEKNKIFSLLNNIKIALNVCKLSKKFNLKSCLLVSTDKAVMPSNFMGLSKKLCEQIYLIYSKNSFSTKFQIVRFGNVVGSRGSVLPYFQSLIDKRLPLPLTDKRATRYLMSIGEASDLIIKISILGENSKVYLLDMGNPKNLYEIAFNLVKFNGLSVKNKNNPTGDIIIKIIGLSKGEKLHEKLSYKKKLINTKIDKIFISPEKYKNNFNIKTLEKFLIELEKGNYDINLEKKLKIFLNSHS